MKSRVNNLQFHEKSEKLSKRKLYDLYWSIVKKFIESEKTEAKNNEASAPATSPSAIPSSSQAEGPSCIPTTTGNSSSPPPGPSSLPVNTPEPGSSNSAEQISPSDAQDEADKVTEKSSSSTIPVEKDVQSSEASDGSG